MTNEEWANRMLLAVERIAVAEERIANALEGQSEDQNKFGNILGNIFGKEDMPKPEPQPTTTGPIDSPADEPPTLKDPVHGWFIDTNSPNRDVHVWLTDGTHRIATPEEGARLK